MDKLPSAAATAQPPWPDQIEVTDQDAIRMLANLRSIRYLRPFIRSAHTLSSAARAMHKPTSTLAHWIPRFVHAGLLIHLGDEQRAGMAMPVYRAPAKQLTVPFEAIPFDLRVSLLDQGRMLVLNRFLDGLDEAIATTAAFSIGFSANGEEGFAIEMIEDDLQKSQRHFTDGWMSIELDEADAKHLAQELEALLEKYARRNGRNRYLVHGGVAPNPRHRWRSAGDPAPT